MEQRRLYKKVSQMQDRGKALALFAFLSSLYRLYDGNLSPTMSVYVREIFDVIQKMQEGKYHEEAA